MIRYTTVPSPLGEIVMVGGGAALTHLWFAEEHRHVPEIGADWVRDGAPFETARAQLAEYFAGDRTTFDLDLDPTGTDFQRAVWDQLLQIPAGITITYGELAARSGRPGAARAAGAANGRNPISIIIPCHRVVASSGHLTDYGGGLHRKCALLELEHHAEQDRHAPADVPPA